MDRRCMLAAHWSTVRWCFGAAALCAVGAQAQVTPVEPFGGRPFGADPTAPSPAARAAQQQQSPAPMVVQPGAAPVVVQPGAGPVMVQPPIAGQPQTQPQAQPQQPGTSSMGMTGQPGRPTSSVNPQPPAPPAPAAPPMQQNPNTSADSPSDGGPQQNGSAPQRAMTSPPSSVTPPFAGNRPPGAAGASSSGAQQTPVRGLPPDAPRLVISGAVYSPDPARRMLIVNGQVVREGADLGSGVVLEEVRPESAVLGFRGSRYNVFF